MANFGLKGKVAAEAPKPQVVGEVYHEESGGYLWIKVWHPSLGENWVARIGPSGVIEVANLDPKFGDCGLRVHNDLSTFRVVVKDVRGRELKA